MDVIAFGGLGGRVDQAFSLIHHLFAASQNPDWLRGHIYLVGLESLSLVLEKGKNVVECGPREEKQDQVDDGRQRLFGENVGIIPVMGRTVITIKGFEWDVEGWETEFGGQVSTSNHLRAEAVEIETSERALFTLEFAERLSGKER